MSLDLQQLKSILTSNTGEPLSCTLDLIYEQLEKVNNGQSVIATVNKLLANNRTRFVGLELLQTLMSYCSYEVLMENGLHWASYCMIHYPEDPNRKIKLNTLTKILENTNSMEFFDKKFYVEYLSVTLKACLVYRSNEEKLACLKCLLRCMQKYPAWFGNHKQKVETFLMECLESSSEAVTESAAAAFICFLETGGAGTNGLNYINNFSCGFRKLCATIQILYNNFFDGYPEINNSIKVDGDVEFIQLPHISDSNKILEATANRIINCLIFVKTMIIKKFSVEKRINPKYVVDIIYRGLSTHVCFSESLVSTSNRCGLLKKIQLHLFDLFRNFVKGYQSSLMPFAVVLKKCLLNTLHRTNQCSCFASDMSYKRSIYKTLVTWLSLSKTMSELHFQDLLIPVVLKDISPIKKGIFLNVDTPGNERLQLTYDGINNRMSLISDNIMKNSCMYALETLNGLLTTSPSINQPLVQEVLFSVVRTLNDVQMNNNIAPYDNTKCQVKLYEVCISIFKLEDLTSLPSIHLIINVLNRGCKNSHWKISRVSREGLELLERISHPVCSTLQIYEPNWSFQHMKHNDMLDITVHDNKNIETSCKLVQQHEENIEKGINIISDILITSSHETTQKDSYISCNDYCKKNNMDEEYCNTISQEVPAISYYEEAVPQNSEPSSYKDEKDVDNSLENMFGSFQDVVQE